MRGCDEAGSESLYTRKAAGVREGVVAGGLGVVVGWRDGVEGVSMTGECLVRMLLGVAAAAGVWLPSLAIGVNRSE